MMFYVLFHFLTITVEDEPPTPALTGLIYILSLFTYTGCCLAYSGIYEMIYLRSILAMTMPTLFIIKQRTGHIPAEQHMGSQPGPGGRFWKVEDTIHMSPHKPCTLHTVYLST